MPRRTTAGLFPERPRAQLRIYAWTPVDPPKAYEGLVKVGQTIESDVNVRVRNSQGTMRQKYLLHVDEPAASIHGSFCDSDVISRLVEKGFENPNIEGSTEWVRCEPDDVKTAVSELQRGEQVSGRRYQTFAMRNEQHEAVGRTLDYYRSIWREDGEASPRFLWNAKMRFGKTFAAYQLAEQLTAKKILIITFKPAVEDSWQSDLESHVDFDNWQFISRANRGDPEQADPRYPIVAFGSFQDLLGRDRYGNIKPRNEWIHTTHWDLVVFDEYHFGAWRERAQELFAGEDSNEFANEFSRVLDTFAEGLNDLSGEESDFLPITAKAYLYLSGTPFRVLRVGEFVEEQIYNWTYADEQAAKAKFSKENPGEPNPYAALPELRLLTYRMPDAFLKEATRGELNEFDLDTFFEATGEGESARFLRETDVQKWLDLIRGEHLTTQIDALKQGTRPPLPYSDARLLDYMQHSLWYLPRVASCHAMANLLRHRRNTFWHDYEVLTVAGSEAGLGAKALPPVRAAIRDGIVTKTITLSCGKLTTGVTVPQWSSMLMLRNLKSPESYFQAAFRVQSPWSLSNPNGDDPHLEVVEKPVCIVFDFAPTRALSQVAEYGAGLAPHNTNPETAVADLLQYLPVLAYNGADMVEVSASDVFDIAMSGTSATLLAKKWESVLLVNVDNDTLRSVMDDPEAMSAIMKIEGFRSLGGDIIEAVVNKSEALKDTKKKRAGASDREKKKLSDEEKKYKSKRKQIQEKLMKFATRIPAFMYLTDFRENELRDVITLLEPDLFRSVTGLEVRDFELLVSLGVFNAPLMNKAVFAFRRYEDASLSYTGIDSHPNLRSYGLYDTVVAVEDS